MHTDALGSPVAVTDASKTPPVEQTDYEPFGWVSNRAYRDGPGYTGHMEDAASKLNYMQQRYYDPQIGRFLSVDPVTAGSPGGNFNRYWYANDNPYLFKDPDGRQSCDGDRCTPTDIMEKEDQRRRNSGQGYGGTRGGTQSQFSIEGASPGSRYNTTNFNSAATPDPNVVPGGPWTPRTGDRPGTLQGPKQIKGPRDILHWVPEGGKGGPPTSIGYWNRKFNDGRPQQRYDRTGRPIGPEEAHPSYSRSAGRDIGWFTKAGVFLTLMLHSEDLLGGERDFDAERMEGQDTGK